MKCSRCGDNIKNQEKIESKYEYHVYCKKCIKENILKFKKLGWGILK